MGGFTQYSLIKHLFDMFALIFWNSHDRLSKDISKWFFSVNSAVPSAEQFIKGLRKNYKKSVSWEEKRMAIWLFDAVQVRTSINA